MRHHSLTAIGICFLLAGCNAAQTSISEQNMNPLTASRYGDELADTLANLIISGDPVMEKSGMTDYVNKEIARAKSIASNARLIQEQGAMGAIIPIGQDAQGYVLYADDTLYFSSDFVTDPGPDLHAYLTGAVDPRDGEFPDETAVDLGKIQSAYGAQAYRVPNQKDPRALRTFVIWDKALGKLYGFAQLDE